MIDTWHSAPAPARPSESRRAALCAVSLVDRRTGAPHRLNGTPLVLFTRNPAEAVAELLSGRDTRVWEARVEAIFPGRSAGS